MKLVFTTFFGLLTMMCAHAQLKKFYSLHDESLFDTVKFKLHATSGHCYFRTIEGGDVLNIYGNPDLEKINPSFDAKVIDNSCFVNLDLNEYRISGLGDGLAFAVFSDASRAGGESESNYWKMLVNDKKVYDLDLHYGIGTSNIDLSGAAVKNLKITTGSAEVNLNYEEDMFNQIRMDTFMIKSDLGTIATKNIYRSRAKNVIAEIGFGKVALDFSEPGTESCSVKATVGAGNLEVSLPQDTPIIIYIKESPLCGVKISRDFEEVEKNVFVNMDYDAKAPNLLSLQVDVSLGSVVFDYD